MLTSSEVRIVKSEFQLVRQAENNLEIVISRMQKRGEQVPQSLLDAHSTLQDEVMMRKMDLENQGIEV